MLPQMISVQLYKTFRQSILWIEVAIVAAAVLFIEGALYIASRVDPGAAGEEMAQMTQMLVWPGALMQYLGMASGTQMGAFLAIVLIGTVVAQEYQWRTLNLWLGSGVPRPVYAVARFVSLLLPVLLFVLVSVLVGGIASGVVTVIMEGSLKAETVNWAQFAIGIVRTAYTVLPYAGLAFLLATITRSMAAAIGGGLAILLIVEGLFTQVLGLLGGVWAEATLYFPSTLASVLMQHTQDLVVGTNSASAAAGMPSPLAATVGIALYTLLFFGLALWRLNQQEISG